MPRLYHVRVQSTPERLERVGPLVPGRWSPQDDQLGRSLAGQFLLDTGAYGAMIDADAAETLQLLPRGTREVHGIHGHGRLQQYFARLVLPARDGEGKDCLFEQVLECVAVPSLTDKSRENDTEVIGILGRMFLQSARLEIDGGAGRVSLLIQR